MLRVNGFHGHVRRNDFRSLAMFIGFLVAFQLLAAVVLFVPLVFLDIRHSLLLNPWNYLGRYGPVILAAGLGLFAVGFLRHVATVKACLDFTFTDRRAEPRLCRIVETLAIATGLPFPRVAIIETPARNAFACGTGASSAVVVVTRGLLDALDDDELAAVAAHEIAHIRNGDIRLMAAANVFMDNLALLRRGNILRIKGPLGVIVAVLFPLFLYLVLIGGFVGSVALTIARLSRLLISSSREFVADAEAVRLTHNPAALISALRRIENRSTVAGLSPQADAMMIDGPTEGAFASHPTVAERIAVVSRLSGDMLRAAGPRRDTRPFAQVLANRDPVFGRKAAPPAPARSIVQRVAVDARTDGFGLTRGVRIGIGVGAVLLLGMQFSAIFLFRPRAVPMSAAEETAWQHQRALRAEAERLAALPPEEARCFATEPYAVGDRGLKTLNKPDPKLVAAFSRGGAAASDEIVPERYLGLRLRSVQGALHANGAGRDGVLLAYAQMRKTLLEVMHRFFGEPGLALMREAYRSSEDRRVLAALRARLESGRVLGPDARTAAELRLLVSVPEEFVPCLARAAEPGRLLPSAEDASPSGVFRL